MRKAIAGQRRRVEKPGLTEEEIEAICDAFNWFDTEGTGMLDTNELRAAMLSLNFDTKSPSVFHIVCEIDKKYSGPIDFETFLDEITFQLGDRESRDGIQKIFALFDDDQTNSISFKNLKRVANEIGETMTDEELREMIERADSNGDGELSFEDFYNVMIKKAFS